MNPFRRKWRYYLVTILVILGVMWLLRHVAIGYYAQGRALEDCINCGRTTAAQVHHLDYLGGCFDTFTVIVALLGGMFGLLVPAWCDFATMPTLLPAPKPVGNKQTMAAPGIEQDSTIDNHTTGAFEAIMRLELPPIFWKATSRERLRDYTT